MQSSAKKILITGVSGFLGSNCAKAFLDSGYIVRGTVRSVNNPAKIDPLREAFGPAFERLELVEADLMNEESLARAAEGVDFICHTASPIPASQPKDENELVTPAVNGTLGIMRAAHRNGVKRMVMTSSCASIEKYPRDRK